ncbi:hypothetical protein MUK70_15425 [Dyadobacter chenwenxiniae]|uniref:Uncharacterized protein n=1 Tax=Dyadobacter chenwenxiniae TaxID=2906456 RepID=A0A9X1PJH3_9BACT|nr:hypothetical protein [Dyadobacter chenwenxiniae]MCF0060633.1 hypothetical protein [Dyadobacter chenwenxiniae]UON80465.1 hypothetical protein MUK70_15425 [Dyadobacter chenwenxiniae]
MRLICTTCFYLLVRALAFSQTQELSPADIKEIRAEARKVVEVQLNDLLNTVALDNITESNKQLLIYDSYLPSQNQVFYGDKAMVEDDVNPDNTVKKSGPDLPIRKYLDDLKLYYNKSPKYSIKISEVAVGQVQQKEYPYVQVTFKTHFTNTHRQKATKYENVYRVAELRADKPDKQWIVLITRIGYYQPSANTVATAPTATAPVVASAPVAVKKPEETKKIEEAKKPEEPKKTATVVPEKAAVTAVANKEPDNVPKKEAPAKSTIKEEVPVAELKKPEGPEKKETPKTEPKKETPATVKPAEKSPEMVPTAPKDRRTVTLNAELASLERKAAKYKRESTLIRAGAGIAVVASIATGVILYGAYNDYKSEIDKNNAAFDKWYDTEVGGVRNGERFNSRASYHARPNSLISFASPGIFVAGAGIIAGGVLWFVGSKSAKEAKRYNKLLEQKRKQIVVSPQWNGTQRYAGVHLTYQF